MYQQLITKALGLMVQKSGETCIGSGVFLINGRSYADKQKGSYTYYKRMGKSTVDYLLMSQLSVNLLRDFKIGQLIQIIVHFYFPCLALILKKILIQLRQFV